MRYILCLSTVWYRGRSNLVGAGSADGCSESCAHPDPSLGGKCVRVNKWQKDAHRAWPEAASGTRDLPEAKQDGDATQAFPATRGFSGVEESPMTGAGSTGPGGSAGPGAGWFGTADEASRREGRAGGNADQSSPDAVETRSPEAHAGHGADETETAGSGKGRDRDRIGGRPMGDGSMGGDRTDRGRGRDPFGQQRITWTGATPSGADRSGTSPAGTDASAASRSGEGRPGTSSYGAGPTGKSPFGRNVSGASRSGEERSGTNPSGTSRGDADRDLDRDLDRDRDLDKTDVLPPTPSATPANSADPTRALPVSAPEPATAVLRDPWQQSPDTGATDHAHDPHEVTVQLDAVQLGDGVLRRVDAGPGKGGPDGSDGPVFVDASGRRSRLYRRLGIAVGLACAVYAVVIVSTLLSGNSNAPWLPVPGQQEGKPAGQVDTTPVPSETAQPSGTGSAAPQTSPSAGTGVTPAPGSTDAPTPGTSGSARQPGTSADPDPSGTTGTDPKPGGGGATAPDPTTSTQAPPPVTTEPSTPAGGGETTVDPTAPTVDPTSGTDPGGDDTTANGAGALTPVAGTADGTADGPADGTVVAAGPDPSLTSSSLSPENTL